MQGKVGPDIMLCAIFVEEMVVTKLATYRKWLIDQRWIFCMIVLRSFDLVLQCAALQSSDI